eukprot:GHVT01043697.1.p1 GENE.GHVT01043697.1~~GHVT01043697.1.p1  ORF type:complete len:188 (-),score=2.73 GHVT01043697.1:55-618(-)
MDFLTAADAWLGARDGKFHMRVDEHEVICQLRREDYRIRLLARPSREATIEPMSHGVVPCTVESRELSPTPILGVHVKTHTPINLVTETVWWPSAGIQIPPALVNNSEEIMVPFTNLSNVPLTMGVNSVIALLDEADGEAVAMGPRPRPTTPQVDVTMLPVFLEDLCSRSTESLTETSDQQAVHDLL